MDEVDIRRAFVQISITSEAALIEIQESCSVHGGTVSSISCIDAR
jgi:hypothetical protein